MDFMKLFPLFGFIGSLSMGFVGDEDDGGVGDDEEINPESPEIKEKEGDELPEDFDAKRAYGENKRKGEKITELEKKLAELEGRISKPAPVAEKKVDILEYAMQDPEVAKDIARYKERFGADDDDVRSMLRISGYGAKRTVDSAISPINDSMADATLEKVISEHKQDPELKFVIEKYGAEIKQFLVDKNVARQFWGNKEFIYNVIGGVVAKHLKELKGEGKKIDREILGEGGTGHKGQGSAGIDMDAVKDFASTIGYSAADLGDKDIRKKVIDAYKASEAYSKT